QAARFWTTTMTDGWTSTSSIAANVTSTIRIPSCATRCIAIIATALSQTSQKRRELRSTDTDRALQEATTTATVSRTCMSRSMEEAFCITTTATGPSPTLRKRLEWRLLDGHQARCGSTTIMTGGSIYLSANSSNSANRRTFPAPLTTTNQGIA